MQETTTQPNPTVTAQPKDETVKVILKPSEIPPFEMKSSQLIKKGRLKFDNDHFPGFNVSFELDDSKEHSGYRFPTNPADALAAKRLGNGDNPCPGKGETWDQFKPISVTTDRMSLVVRNLNEYQADFGFTLFVTRQGTGGEETLVIDPIGTNGNGTRS